jgi:hypothetical protein
MLNIQKQQQQQQQQQQQKQQQQQQQQQQKQHTYPISYIIIIPISHENEIDGYIQDQMSHDHDFEEIEFFLREII